MARALFRYGDTALKGEIKTLAFATPRQRAEVLYTVTPSRFAADGASEEVKAVITVRAKAGDPLAVINVHRFGVRYLHGHLSCALKEAGYGAMAKAVNAAIPS